MHANNGVLPSPTTLGKLEAHARDHGSNRMLWVTQTPYACGQSVECVCVRVRVSARLNVPSLVMDRMESNQR